VVSVTDSYGLNLGFLDRTALHIRSKKNYAIPVEAYKVVRC
jgi:hypothetical protein